jgi:hypothetical protein
MGSIDEKSRRITSSETNRRGIERKGITNSITKKHKRKNPEFLV